MVGNLTRDPQLSFLPSNTPVVEFGLATNRRWRGTDGQMKEETCFVDCRSYGKSAETINQYMSKGRQLLVEGRLQFQQWTGQDGGKRSKHVVIVEQFQFMDSRRDSAGAGEAAASPKDQAAGAREPADAGAGPAAPGGGEIPF